MAKWLSWLTGQPAPDTPVSFGYKMVWFAVRTTDAHRVAAALGLRQPQPCNWKTGVDRAYAGEDVFITPPVDGWTMALGFPLSGEEAEIAVRLEALSREFAEAQYFGTHRVSEYHGWARSVNGKIIRHYAYVGDQGETLRNEGPAGEIEPELPDEETVMQIAEAWSVNPISLEGRRDLLPALGLLAR